MAPKPKRKRDYAAAYRRRDERAKAAGYKNYYDYRLHGYGKQPPAAPLPPKGQRARLRGHRSGRDLERKAKRNAGLLVTAILADRQADGTFAKLYVNTIDQDGKETEYMLTGHQLDKDYLKQLVADLEAAGAVFSPSPSTDLRQIAG